jgi:hypothetical protein
VNERPLFVLSISNELPIEEQERLLSLLRGTDELSSQPQSSFSPDWVEFLIILKDVGTIAGATASLITLANQINTWRRSVRQCDFNPKVRLRRPRRPQIDLSTATDEEVTEWLSKP